MLMRGLMHKVHSLLLFTRRQRAMCGYLYTHTATVREREKLAKRTSHCLYLIVSVEKGIFFYMNDKLKSNEKTRKDIEDSWMKIITK